MCAIDFSNFMCESHLKFGGGGGFLHLNRSLEFYRVTKQAFSIFDEVIDRRSTIVLLDLVL